MVRTPVAAVLFLLLPGLALAQGLGDVSRREKKRREAQPPAQVKVYTQDDVAGLPPVANEASGDEGASVDAPSAAPEETASSTDAQAAARAGVPPGWLR
jgi:hypothetical protein